jgi:small subunit ribosomal protein S7
MESGKKSIAENIVYGAFDQLKHRLLGKTVKKQDGDEDKGGSGDSDLVVTTFESILNNVRPSVEVKSRRVGGATYQVPVEVRSSRSTALAMRWVVDAAKSRSERGMMLRLAGELMDAHENRGGAVKKREDMHRMAKANQAFAHYRW